MAVSANCLTNRIKLAPIVHVAPASVVRDLGIYLDSDVSMRSHVAKTIFACFLELRDVSFSVRRSLPRTVLQSLKPDVVTPPVTTGLYGNATLHGCQASWHSIVPSSAAPVDHDLGGATRVLFVDVQPHQRL